MSRKDYRSWQVSTEVGTVAGQVGGSLRVGPTSIFPVTPGTEARTVPLASPPRQALAPALSLAPCPSHLPPATGAFVITRHGDGPG